MHLWLEQKYDFVVHGLKQLMFGLAATLVVATLRLQGSPPASNQKRDRQNDH